VFSARIVPIPARGTKRVEFEYQERLPLEQLQSQFVLPLKPDVYAPMIAGRLYVSVEITSPDPLKSVTVSSKSYPLQLRQQTSTSWRADWQGQNVSLDEDLSLQYRVDAAAASSLRVIAHRDSQQGPGYFEASLAVPLDAPAAQGPPRTVV